MRYIPEGECEGVVVARVSESVILYVESPSCLPAIKEALSKDKGGRGNVIMVAQAGDYQVEIKLPNGYALGADTITTLRSIPGIGQVKQV